jgi:hypothetical protein
MLLFGVEAVEGFTFDKSSEPYFRVYNVHTPNMRDTTVSVSEVTEFVWTGLKDDPIKVVRCTKDSIPDSIFNYVKAYPTFGYFTGESWNTDIANNSKYLYGVVNMFSTVSAEKINGKETYSCDSRSSFNKKPHQLASKIREEGFPKPPVGIDDPKRPPGLTYSQELQSDMYLDSLLPRGLKNGSPKEDKDVEIKL